MFQLLRKWAVLSRFEHEMLIRDSETLRAVTSLLYSKNVTMEDIAAACGVQWKGEEQ